MGFAMLQMLTAHAQAPEMAQAVAEADSFHVIEVEIDQRGSRCWRQAQPTDAMGPRWDVFAWFRFWLGLANGLCPRMVTICDLVRSESGPGWRDGPRQHGVRTAPCMALPDPLRVSPGSCFPLPVVSSLAGPRASTPPSRALLVQAACAILVSLNEAWYGSSGVPSVSRT